MNPPVRLILKTALRYFGLPKNRFPSPGNVHALADQHQATIYLCRRLTKLSTPQIGDIFWRDHTTILYAVERSRAAQRANPVLRADVVALRFAIARAHERFKAKQPAEEVLPTTAQMPFAPHGWPTMRRRKPCRIAEGIRRARADDNVYYEDVA
jgi:hypothetical protein